MEIFVLASGSKGNITYVKHENVRFFIDAGISYKKIVEKMRDYGENIADVDTLFLTHEHSDHIFGLLSLLKAGYIRNVYLTSGTLNALSSEIKNILPTIHIIEADKLFNYNTIEVLPILLSHDANEPVGFRFDSNEKRFVLLTDTGYVDQSYLDILKDADLYLLESNHDPKMLLNSRRPFGLKQRILGVLGHLSNEEAAILMNKLIQSKQAKWVVAHISDECNSEELIETEIIKHFDDVLKVEVFYASQNALPAIKL